LLGNKYYFSLRRDEKAEGRRARARPESNFTRSWREGESLIAHIFIKSIFVDYKYIEYLFGGDEKAEGPSPAWEQFHQKLTRRRVPYRPHNSLLGEY